MFVGLLRAAGPAERGIAKLTALKLPAAAAADSSGVPNVKASIAPRVRLSRLARPQPSVANPL